VTTPTVSVERAVAQAIPSGSNQVLTPNVMRWDTNSFWSPTVNPKRLTVHGPGIYLFGAQLLWTTAFNTFRQCWFQINGAGQYARAGEQVGAATSLYQTTQGIWYFDADDYLELVAFTSNNNDLVRIGQLWMTAITPEAIIPNP